MITEQGLIPKETRLHGALSRSAALAGLRSWSWICAGGHHQLKAWEERREADPKAQRSEAGGYLDEEAAVMSVDSINVKHLVRVTWTFCRFFSLFIYSFCNSAFFMGLGHDRMKRQVRHSCWQQNKRGLCKREHNAGWSPPLKIN